MGMLDILGLQRLLANGVEIVRRRAIEFRGGVTIEDDEVRDVTVINVSGGGGGEGAPLSDVAPTPITGGATSSQGTSDAASRGNHRHAVQVATPVDIGPTNDIGTGTALCLATHVHRHGSQGGGEQHTPATPSAAGFMTPAHIQAIADNASAIQQCATSGSLNALASVVDGKAPNSATYIVRTLSTELTAELALEGADGVTVDFATPNKAIVRGPGAVATPASVAALKAPTYIVQTASADLDNERVLLCTSPLTANWATAGQVTLSMPAATTSNAGHMTAAHAAAISNQQTAITSLRAPSYLVQTASADLDNERMLSGADGITVDFATAGQAIVRGASLALKDFDIALWTSGFTRQITLADRNKLILCQVTTGPLYLILLRDSTLNLPTGFTCQLWGDVFGVSPEWNIEIQSEVMNAGTLGLGIPMRVANGQKWSETVAPYATRVGPANLVTLAKIAADKWMVSGHYAAP